ncbi:unnamed protein product [Blepharisma stoltei]|uniref:EF-hand domain-containing protein n=1 Tax=Blepharisma stoltei TaxID=1481888 RepID=A0AAU9I9V3_9CILI|nr:unnamed protein product [Blepharisma stoltei]
MSYIQDYQRGLQPTLPKNKSSLLEGKAISKSDDNSIKPSRRIFTSKNPKSDEMGYINDHERNLLSSIDQELKKLTETPDYRISQRLLNDIMSQNSNDELEKAKLQSENQKLWGPYIVLLDQQKRLLEDIFKEADTFDDGTVQKYIYLHTLRNNKDIIKILHTNTIQISEDNFLNLEQALDIIENDGDLYEEITFPQFMEYFDLIYKSHSQLTGWISERTETLLDNKYLKIIKNIFDALPNHGDRVLREEFIFSLFDDPQVQGFLKLKAREDKVTNQIESVEDVLNRIDKESAEFLKWNDIIDFFCSIGAPKRTLKEKLDMIDFERKKSYINFIDQYDSQKNHKNEDKSIENNPQKPNKANLPQNKSSLPQPYKLRKSQKKDKKIVRNAIKTEIFSPHNKVLLITQKSDLNQNLLKISSNSKEKLKNEMPKLEINKFKAKPPPLTNNVPLYNQMVNQLEYHKKLRIESAAKKSLEEAKLPIKRYEKAENKYFKPIPRSNTRTSSIKTQSVVDKFWEEFNRDSEEKLDIEEGNLPKIKAMPNIDKSKGVILNGFESMLQHNDYKNSDSLSSIKHLLGESGKEQLEMSKNTEYSQENQWIKTKNEIDKQRLTKRINHPPLTSDLLSSLYDTSKPTNFITTIKQKMINRGIQREKIVGEVTGLEYVYAEDLV